MKRLTEAIAACAVGLGLLATPVAAQDKQLRIFNWSDYVDPEVLDAFKKETGITVVYDTFDQMETVETKLLAGKTGYDLIVVTASFLPRHIPLGLYQPVDKDKAPNLKNLWPEIQTRLSKYDPGNKYAVNYMWGTTGIGYNTAKIKERLGPDAVIDSWKIVFEPETLKKLSNCGVHVLDAVEEMFPAALRYLGLDPDSKNEADLNKAGELLRKIRPHIQKFHSSEYINALANGDICLAVGYSGDILQAKKRAEEAKNGVQIAYSIPKEGALMWFDSFVIPKDAGNVDAALKFIDFVNRPAMAAKNSDFIQYANGNIASKPLLSTAVRDNPGIYPSDAVMARLYTITPYDQKAQRLVNRLWTRVKTGKVTGFGQGASAMKKTSPGSVRRAFQPWNDPAAKPLVEFRGVTKRFGNVTAVGDLSLALYPREFFALLGPSGCGKTTLMRMLAGFEAPDAGTILLDGQDITGIPPHLRPINMMFQSYALFPHMSVANNIAYGLKREGLPRAEIDRRVEEMLALVKLSGFGGRKPHQLSGGQRQRVALARSLAKRPKLLLLDEPMAALDKKLREQTQFELMDLQSELGLTFMVVTHDQDEAMTMADRMAVMDHGKLVQIGPPDVIYEAPANRHVAEFVGDVNIFEGRIATVEGELIRAEVPFVGTVELDEEAPVLKSGEPLVVGIRPEKIEIAHDEPTQAVNKVAGEIWDIGYLGDFTMIQVMLGGDGGQLVKVALANRTRRLARPFAWDDKVWLSWDVEAGVVLPA